MTNTHSESVLTLRNFSHDEIASLEGVSSADLEKLRLTFTGLLGVMDLYACGRSNLVDAAHQSHHMGWDHVLMEELAADLATVERAEIELRASNPDAVYFAFD